MYVLDAERMAEPHTGTHTGTITFLFTDVEGSTSLWERNPKAMSEALVRHDEILRTAIEAHDGHVFKTVGDAFHATFSAAPDALDAALEAQRARFSMRSGPRLDPCG
jgi:class 3 adenylate cyclase